MPDTPPAPPTPPTPPPTPPTPPAAAPPTPPTPPGPPAGSAPPAQPAKKSNTGKIIGGIVGGCLLIAVIIGIILAVLAWRAAKEIDSAAEEFNASLQDLDTYESYDSSTDTDFDSTFSDEEWEALFEDLEEIDTSDTE